MGIEDIGLGLVPEDWPSRLLLALVPVAVTALVSWMKRRGYRDVALRGRLITIQAIQDLASNPALGVQYGNQRIPNLNVLTALVWSSGRKEVRASNVASSDPVAIDLPEGTQVLEASLLHQSRAGNRVQVSHTARRIHVEFEFLNPKDFFLVHCLYTGPPNRVVLAGQLVGASVGLDYEWSAQAGIHGEPGGTHLVNLSALRTIGTISTLAQVILLGVAFIIQSWLVVLALAAALGVLAIWSAWQTNPVPRGIRKELESLG